MAASPPAASIEVNTLFSHETRTVAVRDAASAQIAARLRKVGRERRRWAQREGIAAWRLYDADLPEYACAIEVFEGAGESAGLRFALLAEYQAPKSVDPQRAADRFADACAIARAMLEVDPERFFERRRLRARGGSQYRLGASRSVIAHTEEAGCLVELDFGPHLDVGLFLDHRITRALVGQAAAGGSFLNLFAYTGVATLHAMRAGARATTTVDLSATYLDRARRNARSNGFTGREHRFVRADATAWLAEAWRTEEPYDVIFVDPPTFSNSKAMGERTWDVQRDHVRLLADAQELLDDDGLIAFSCNLRSFRLDEDALAAAGLLAVDITAPTIPVDFARNPRIHRCFALCKRRGSLAEGDLLDRLGIVRARSGELRLR